MAENKKTEVALNQNIGDSVISRVNDLCQAGFIMPADFNHVNSIKMSMIKLAEIKDRNGKGVFEVCTPQSIQSALFKMVTKGLNIAYNQAYPIIRGNQLCIDPSYFGNTLMVKRIYPDWDPVPRVIREGDEFIMETDTRTGRRKLIKHVQTLESMDADFKGGYIVLPTKDGEGDLYVMSKKQILSAWSKSSNSQQTTHKQFQEKMIGKTLINSGCTLIINSTPELQSVDLDSSNDTEDVESKVKEPVEFHEFEEVTEVVTELPKAEKSKPEAKAEPVDTNTGEIFDTDSDDVF